MPAVRRPVAVLDDVLDLGARNRTLVNRDGAGRVMRGHVPRGHQADQSLRAGMDERQQQS
ncbi:hypothetical protein ACIBL8_18825 [Streptomyces sp. NPDC050523]|uniref:hypothetical protein n=1 Tax=Streptomyces sp. NPDC050523 TaxID=3365622 RepID=UPI00378DB208